MLMNVASLLLSLLTYVHGAAKALHLKLHVVSGSSELLLGESSTLLHPGTLPNQLLDGDLGLLQLGVAAV
jgi:hypothetical protein